jgi:hypothetical protein
MACGLVELVVAGPAVAVAVVAGAGVVVAATTTGTAGGVIRKCGGATPAVCGSTAETCSRVRKLNDKHNFVGKTSQKMQQLNEKHRLVYKTKEAAKQATKCVGRHAVKLDQTFGIASSFAETAVYHVAASMSGDCG